jgi:nucleotide-binding universal stress UspA family protein
MFGQILVPLDSSPLAECVLPHSLAFAEAFNANITLLQVLKRSDVVGNAQPVDALNWHMGKAEAQNYLDGVSSRFREAGRQTKSIILEGLPADRVIEYAHGNEISLIILSSHGRSGLSGWNVSSVVQKIIQRAHIPTMIVRAYQPVRAPLTELRYRNILIPLDSSPRAECAMPVATQLARHFNAHLLTVHVVCRPEMPGRTPLTEGDIQLLNKVTERNRINAERYLEQIDAQISKTDIDLETRLLVSEHTASTLHEIVDQENIDLVVMSAHGSSGETKWPYGSIVNKFITFGTTPLLIFQDLSIHEFESTQAEIAAQQFKGH